MPCILSNPDERRELVVYGMRVGYFEASGDLILFDVIRADRLPDGTPKDRDVALRVVAEHVCDWQNVAERVWFVGEQRVAPGTPDAEERTVEVEYPARGKRPRPTTGPATSDHVTDADVAARTAVLRRLPWNVLRDMDNAVGRAYVEAAASGKD